MDLCLAGKVALVMGGSKGIGFECARLLAREGARVAIAARDTGGLDVAVEKLREEGLHAHPEAADLRDADAVEALVARVEAAVGAIEILVNSAGAAKQHVAQSPDAARWRAGMEDKYLPSILAMDAVVHRMAARGGGAVVNVVGMGGKIAKPTHIAGGAANAALMLASAGFARAWGSRGVRVNTINPGAIETQRLIHQLQVKSESSGQPMDAARAQTLGEIPLGRYGTPQEIAALAAFLASPLASYVTGASIAVDGGAGCVP